MHKPLRIVGGREADLLRKNPVAEKVEVVEGIDLMNVKAVVDKYGGDFAVSCDDEKFQTVVTDEKECQEAYFSQQNKVCLQLTISAKNSFYDIMSLSESMCLHN